MNCVLQPVCRMEIVMLHAGFDFPTAAVMKRRRVPLKLTLTFKVLYGIMSQKIVLCHSTFYQSIFVFYSIWNSNVPPSIHLDHFLLYMNPQIFSTITVS